MIRDSILDASSECALIDALGGSSDSSLVLP